MVNADVEQRLMAARAYRPCQWHAAGNTGRPEQPLFRCIPCAVWVAEHPEDAARLRSFEPGTHIARKSDTYSDSKDTGRLRREHAARRRQQLETVPPVRQMGG